MANNNQQLSLPSEGESKIELFQRKAIRKVMHNGEWWFAVVDVIAALTESTNPVAYLRDMRRRDEGFAKGWEQIATPLPIQTSGGTQNINCTNIEGIFRVMQSVPSPKAEPFKKWLARVGFERLEEIENPELAIQRAITIYRSKGYDDTWIGARIRNKASREMLTSEWYKRGVKDGKNIAILTDAIAVETFGISIKKHHEIKGLKLKTHSLRDNMTPLELTLTTLGEQATTEFVKSSNPTTMPQHEIIARKGGSVAGTARKQIEAETGQKVVSSQNYLTERQRQNNAKTNEGAIALDEVLDRFLNLPSAPAEKPTKIANPKGFDDTMDKIIGGGA